MKTIIETTETEGLESLLGEQVTIFCCRYIYAGKLVGVNDVDIKLKDPKIVYETGDFADSDWSNAESLPREFWYIRVDSIESYGLMK